MHFERDGLNGCEEPGTHFLNELDARLNSIRTDCCSVATPCHCKFFARIQRVFDLARMLGITRITRHEHAIQPALDSYRLQGDTRPACDLLSVLQTACHEPSDNQAIPRYFPANEISQQPPIQYIIHLAIAGKLDGYLGQQFTRKKYQVIVHDNPQDIADTLGTPGKHIVVIDEVKCQESGISPFDFIVRHKNANCSFIVLTPVLNFNKRLLAARHDALLVLQSGCDDMVLSQSIEKCIAMERGMHQKIIVITGDEVLAACLRSIVHAAGISLDIVKSPSDALLKQLENNDYVLVLIDCFLDEMDGHELAKIIRQDDILAQIPVIYLGSGADIDCDEHSWMLESGNRIIDTYEPEIISKIILETITQSACNHRISRFMIQAVRENENYRRAMDAHSIISVADVAGRIIEVNQMFCEVSGYDRDELIGRNHNIVNSGTHPREFFIDMWKTIASGKIWQGEICNRKKDGSLYWVESTIVPFLDESGKPYQYVSARTEVSRIKQIQNNLRDSQSRLIRSQSFANIGTWDWNIQNGDLYWTPRIPPLFGYAEGELETTYENFLNAVHPDDRQSVMDAVNDCVYQGKDYEIEHRCVWPDGSIKWMLERGDVVRDKNGIPMHMLGVVMDISARKLAEEQNVRQKHLLEMLRIGLSWYLEEHDLSHVADFMLESLLMLTESKFGLVGGIHHDEHNNPYLKCHTVSNIGWDSSAQDFYTTHYSKSLEFHNLDNLIGEVIKTGRPVISNNPAQDPRRGGLPHGHPPLESYLGVPIFRGDKLIAMYCLANKRHGYEEDIIEFLKPFNVTYSAIIQASGMIKTQRETLDELQRSRKEAIDANLAKSQFLSSMSHELRTPLNAILGFGQLLEMNLDRNLTGTQRDSINEILKAGQHLLELINQVLDLAKIESGKIDLFIEPVNVVPVLLDCADTVSPLAVKRHISMHWCLNGDAVSTDQFGDRHYVVSADRLRLKQILINFLSNAIKYNHDNGSITLCIRDLEPDMIRISVKDTGKGIPSEKQARLFHAFDRLGEEGSEIEGTGIGLVITKNIAELMHGKIGFHSVEGSGSEFWIDLPANRHESTDKYSPDNTGKLSDSGINSGRKLKKIVYIEDNPANMRLMQSILRAMDGVELVTEQEAYLGYELVKLYRPDMVLLDINMPGMDGYQVLDKIRHDPVICHIPVVAVSANAMQSDIANALNAGFNAYVTKPIIVSRLLGVINDLTRDTQNHEIP